jgi:hypothetical protein
MRILFEGTDEQIANLIKLAKTSKVDLPTPKAQYQTANLQTTYDVQGRFKCTDKQALEVTEQALLNEATQEQINFAIGFHAEEMGLEEIKDTNNSF